MIRRFLIVLFLGVFLSNTLPFRVRAEPMSPSTIVQVCGAYRYDVERLIDGLLIKVTDGARVRSLFYKNVRLNVSGYSDSTSIISGCDGNALPIVDESSSKYHISKTINIIDPNGKEPKILQVGTVGGYTFYTGPKNTDESQPVNERVMELLSRPVVELSATRPALVRQQSIQPEKNDLLHSQQYAVFAQNGVELRNTFSNWNTTVALDSRVCANGIAYVLYEKQFAEEDVETSAYPAKQYVIERSGDGRRSIVPIPHVNGDWRDLDRRLYAPLFDDCFDQNVGLLVNGNIVMVTPQASYVDYRASDHTLTTYQYEIRESSEGPYQYRYDYTIRKADYGYWIPEMLYRTADGVEGNADISFLSAGGSSFIRKPVFFRDIKQYPVDTTMTFLLDPEDYLKVIVELSVPSAVKDQPDTVTYFKETDGIYHEITWDRPDWEFPFHQERQFTPLYVSVEQDAIVVKSYFFEQTLTLHAFPGRSPALQWYRVGPLELDGTRKVWYAFSVNGNTQTWFAVVK